MTPPKDQSNQTAADGVSAQEACLQAELAPQCELMRAVYILCHLMMRVMDRVAEPEGLTGSRWHLLVVVRDCGEPLTITQLSERLFLSPQNVSRMIASLEGEGLVTRDTTGPGRTVRVALTETGMARVDACAALAETCGLHMLEGIAPDELHRTTQVLEKTILNTVLLERSLSDAGAVPDHEDGGSTRPPEEA